MEECGRLLHRGFIQRCFLSGAVTLLALHKRRPHGERHGGRAVRVLSEELLDVRLHGGEVQQSARNLVRVEEVPPYEILIW